jgi:hypothetical protein
VDPTSGRCWRCGSEFDSESEPAPVQQAEVPSGALGSPRVPQVIPRMTGPAGVREDAESPINVPVCENCGAAVDTTGAFCWKCGVPLATGRDPFIPEDAPTSSTIEPTNQLLQHSGPSARARGRAHPASLETRNLSRRRSPLAGAFILAGIVLLVLSSLFGWYSTQVNATYLGPPGGHSQESGTEVIYLLNYYTLDFSCSGSPYCPSNLSQTGPYADSDVQSLGFMWILLSGLVVAAIVLGVVGAALAFTRQRDPRRVLRFATLLMIALVALSPAMLAFGQPALIKSNESSTSGQVPPPGTTFYGSCTGASCGVNPGQGELISENWGPSLGWYLCLLAIAPLAIGYLMIRDRPRPSNQAAPFEATR